MADDGLDTSSKLAKRGPIAVGIDDAAVSGAIRAAEGVEGAGSLPRTDGGRGECAGEAGGGNENGDGETHDEGF